MRHSLIRGGTSTALSPSYQLSLHTHGASLSDVDLGHNYPMAPNDSAIPTDQVNAPEELEFIIGGFHGTSFSVRLVDGALNYRVSYNDSAFSGPEDKTSSVLRLVGSASSSDDQDYKVTALSVLEQCETIDDKAPYYQLLGVPTGQAPFPPIDPDWQLLHADLDEIGVWNWQSSYDKPSIGGTTWRLLIKWADREVRTQGTNEYPQDEEGSDAPFSEFMAAVRRQLGGRALH